jgi:hypothetical protein
MTELKAMGSLNLQMAAWSRCQYIIRFLFYEVEAYPK